MNDRRQQLLRQLETVQSAYEAALLSQSHSGNGFSVTHQRPSELRAELEVLRRELDALDKGGGLTMRRALVLR